MIFTMVQAAGVLIRACRGAAGALDSISLAARCVVTTQVGRKRMEAEACALNCRHAASDTHRPEVTKV
jgi:hypothetical protein